MARVSRRSFVMKACYAIFAFASLNYSTLWKTHGFTSVDLTSSRELRHRHHRESFSTRIYVLAEPPRDVPASEQRRPLSTKYINRGRTNYKKKQFNRYKKEDTWSSGKWQKAIQVEAKFLAALDVLEHSIKLSNTGDHESEERLIGTLVLPSIRDCNTALAAFGDGGDLLRALRLYFKMRKGSSLYQRYFWRSTPEQAIPTPTLVTFSTLMSRAVQLGKPQVAVRLWNIMRQQTNFFSACSSIPTGQRIVPDVKAANILMNCYSKLGYVESAQDLLQQMITGNGEDVPRTTPNLVTFNTLLDACYNAGELDVALSVKKQLEATGLVSDARTYTTLIATVARKTTKASGANDPTLAFSLLEEMHNLDIRPNGMTYSALIDVCGRCHRSDLALKGLRLMMDQKVNEVKLLDLPSGNRHTLPAEVGAWTAAINSCGKAGRIDAAIKLFYSMGNYGVYPNTVTCGCLTDCLLRQGRTAESLEVLRYMKKNRIAPSEVMYTSLMTSAGKLAQFENSRQFARDDPRSARDTLKFPVDDSGATSAVEVYTELMTSLMQLPTKKNPTSSSRASSYANSSPDGSNELYKVSLVFQEMKSAGVEPDLACYNALLKSCANAGDVERASEVLEQIRSSHNMNPNDKTWREVIRAAGKANRIDVALSTWKVAIGEMNEAESTTSSGPRLSSLSAVALLEALIEGSSNGKIDRHTQLRLYQLVAKVFEAIISGSSYLGMHLVDRQSVLEDPRAMIIFLQALVALDESMDSFQESSLGLNRKKLRLLAVSIAASECFERGLPFKLRQRDPYFHAFRTAQTWWREDKCSGK